MTYKTVSTGTFMGNIFLEQIKNQSQSDYKAEKGYLFISQIYSYLQKQTPSPLASLACTIFQDTISALRHVLRKTKKIVILLANKPENAAQEKSFFLRYLPAKKLLFLERSSDPFFSYHQLSQYPKLLTISSTLGFEAAALGLNVSFLLFNGDYGSVLQKNFQPQYNLLQRLLPSKYRFCVENEWSKALPSKTEVSKMRSRFCNFQGLKKIKSLIKKEMHGNEKT
ncbi:MAG: hypothetical protein KGQ54_03320 [Verrucomicrobia bacterium]|nr:hypothetical protein [Verrucomicrobiota bacterium]